jgi:hypothetical protein
MRPATETVRRFAKVWPHSRWPFRCRKQFPAARRGTSIVATSGTSKIAIDHRLPPAFFLPFTIGLAEVAQRTHKDTDNFVTK